MSNEIFSTPTFTAGSRAAVVAVVGEGFSEATFQKALRKLSVHIRNKFGAVHYMAEYEENGFEGILAFYKETATLESGERTINNGTAGTRTSKMQKREEAALKHIEAQKARARARN